MTTSVGSSTESASVQRHTTGDFLANLYANKMDLIFETDYQRRDANIHTEDSVTAWVDDVLL